jgi:hypothetical protein
VKGDQSVVTSAVAKASGLREFSDECPPCGSVGLLGDQYGKAKPTGPHLLQRQAWSAAVVRPFQGGRSPSRWWSAHNASQLLQEPLLFPSRQTSQTVECIHGDAFLTPRSYRGTGQL